MATDVENFTLPLIGGPQDGGIVRSIQGWFPVVIHTSGIPVPRGETSWVSNLTGTRGFPASYEFDPNRQAFVFKEYRYGK